MMNRFTRVVAVSFLVVGCHGTISRAQALPCISSWVANSFSDDSVKAWVPDEMRDLCVDSDGTVFTAGYAESHGGGASYKDGTFKGRYDGFDSGFGDPVKSVVADGKFVYFGCGNGVQRFKYGGGRRTNTIALGHTMITGLAIKGNELVASDFSNNKIRVLALDSLKELRSWPVARPGKLAVDGDGRIWVIQYKAGANPNTTLIGERVLSFDKGGTEGPTIKDFDDPLALAMDLQNQLLVGGLNKDGRIAVYGGLNVQPKVVGHIGVEGGIYGRTPGEYAPDKFFWIRGLGVDAKGNLYVACTYGGEVWGQSVVALSAKGESLWQVHGLNYIDCGGLDPRSETDMYDANHHYVLDYSKTGNGREWSLKGFTQNRFQYPTDPRKTGSFVVSMGIRYIRDEPFLCTVGQTGYTMHMFHIDRTGGNEIARPSAHFPGGGSDKPNAIDKNGNGKFEADEQFAQPKGYYQYYDIDTNGDVWIIGDAAGPPFLMQYQCLGLDKSKNPIYDVQHTVRWKVPKEFGSLRRSIYQPGTDVMYLGGRDKGSVEDGVPRICRYDRWSDPQKLSKRWDIELPLNDKSYTPNTNYGGGIPLCLSVAGNYVFIAYGYGTVRVHHADSGKLIGTLSYNNGGHTGGGGEIDASYGMSVTKRKNGEYVVLLESASHNHASMIRWTPEEGKQ